MNAMALYPWLKALHVAAAITFAAGVLAAAVMLRPAPGGKSSAESSPKSSLDSGTVERLRACHRSLTTPAMVIVWALGIVLAMQGGWSVPVWLQAKLALVVALSALHGIQSGQLRRLEGGAAGGVPGLRFKAALTVVLVAGIAILAVAKPL